MVAVIHIMDRKMRVLDLFAGEKGWSQAFADEGHDVVTVEINPAQNPTIVADITQLDADTIRQAFGGHDPDIILASPPCTAFSVASIGKHWQGGFRAYVPKTDSAKFSLKMVEKTLDLIKEVGPAGHFMEKDHTLLNFRKDVWYPSLLSRTGVDDVHDEHVDIITLARQRVAELLDG